MSARNGRGAAHAVSVALLGAVVLALAGCSGSSGRAGATGSSDPSTSTPTTTASTTTTTPGPVPVNTRVDIFGDSLVVQARDALRAEGRAHGLNVMVAAYYGLAPCDLLRPIRDDLVHPPGALVVAFSGNNITPCMAPGGHELVGAAYYATYRRDVTTIVSEAIAKKVAVLVVGPPRFSTVKNVPDRIELDALYRQIVSDHPGARYVTTATVLSPHGFTTTLPCIAGETAALGCHDRVITVRAPDQIHLDAPRAVPCPSGHGLCEYSAGAHRYADVVLAALSPIATLRYRPAPTSVGVPVDTAQLS